MNPDESAFEAWWMRREVTGEVGYYGGTRSLAWAAYQAGIERMKAVLASGAALEGKPPGEKL